MLVKVVRSDGSSPGRRGFMMAVTETGEILGTIGGGLMEARIIAQSVELLSKGADVRVCKNLVHKKNIPESSGLICAGEQRIAMISLNELDIQNVQSTISALKSRTEGTSIYSQTGYSFSADVLDGKDFLFELKSEDDWQYREIYGSPDTIYVFGSGHVGLSVCKVFRAIGFYVVCFDARESIPTVRSNRYADELHIGPYAEGWKQIREGSRSYVAVVTSDRDSDVASLKHILGMRVKYIGAMGSDAKIASIRKELREAGVSVELLDRINAPIGLPINSQTTDEIAISIAAEIIRIKNTE